ncbi:RDD family protein [Phycicoccus endophyticus]|uniref:RDD family protein n=1 Tax=Phycicoccus endophyticus TaxID=1690220 RepID=A0A7G9R3A3_9MICO|nr:RDD family protein [Phycicoccus endophyticus]NHI19824.1 RDD family protein [Phycicoccus endophyticus]QNN50078.1 RDD family protein [Phycicoccus endophyticus]GGL28291.1 hypothetical protein GCM10012283_08130 [Phycicoccus endophyticus]
MSEPTAPGWYTDPEDADQLRYFDGVVWTQHVTPRNPPPPPVTSQPPPAAPGGPAGGPGSAGGWGAPPAYGPASVAGERLPDGDVLAEWWRRLLARVVDAVLKSIVAGLLSLPFLGDLSAAVEDLLSQAVAGDANPDLTALQSALTEATLPVTLIGLAVNLVYEVGFLTWRAATPGKMLLGTRVRPADGPGPVSGGVAVRRQLVEIATQVLGLVPLLGLPAFVLTVLDPAWLLWDPRRQTLHDKVAGTVVVLRR